MDRGCGQRCNVLSLSLMMAGDESPARESSSIAAWHLFTTAEKTLKHRCRCFVANTIKTVRYIGCLWINMRRISVQVDDVVQMLLPEPDSQWRLRRCGCSNDRPVYIQRNTGLWIVRCMECGCETGEHPIRHDAQLEWNNNH